jgi:hypothetical protein
MESFLLIPFQTLSDDPIRISGSIERDHAFFKIQFQFQADFQNVIVPEKSSSPERRYGLWKHTCLEVFLKSTGSDAYYELNISPSGDWNLYHFENYRTGMVEDSSISHLPIEVQQDDGLITVKADLPHKALFSDSLAVSIGISAVVEHTQNEFSYWALKHPQSEPDFHHPKSFIISQIPFQSRN